MSEQKKFTSMIKTIKFQKDDFYILTLIKPNDIKFDNKYRSKFNNHLLTCKGRCIHNIKIGDNVMVEGTMILSSFNNEYVLETKKMDKSFLITEDGFKIFLKTFKGFGASKIDKIVPLYLGDIKNAKRNFIKDVASNNQLLQDILKKALFEKIKNQVTEMPEENLNSSELEFIQEFDIPKGVVKRIKMSGKDLIEVFQKNPYEAAFDVKGIGFKKMDKEAIKIKNKLHVDEKIFQKMRYTAAIYYVLLESEKDGHAFLRYEGVKYLMGQNNLKELDRDMFTDYVEYLISNKVIVNEDDKYYLNWNYKSEIETAKIISEKIQIEKMNNTKVENIEFKFDKGFIPSEKQKEALEKSLTSSLMILTGGPGTGKTSIAKYIYKNLTRLNPNAIIKIMAPTGTAARRISQVIGCSATTIHRGIKHNGVKSFYTQNNPLKADIVIVDESSMIDLRIINSFLNALTIETKVIFIGDVDQLPSVGVGNVLDDMQKAGVQTIRLDRVYRQAGGNPIVDFAYDVNKKVVNYYPFLTSEMKVDAKLNVVIKKSFNKKVNPNASINIENEVIDDYFEYIEKYSTTDVQILTQLRQGGTGSANSINKRVQELINENEFIGDTKFKVGDKVIQTRNNRNKNIFNGSMGFITGYDKDSDIIFIDFIDGDEFIEVTYNANNKSVEEGVSKNLDLSYAITIHKSQGNEWKAIILNMNNYFFINKKLIYTAVTRARESVSVVSDHKILTHGIKTQFGLKEINGKLVEVKRNSTLTKRIQDRLKELSNS